MTKNSEKQKIQKISLIKVLGGLFIVGFILILAFLFTSYQVGPVRELRGVVLFKYVGIIKDKRSDAELIKALASSDEKEQFYAVTAMSYRECSSDNVKALLKYLKSDNVTKRMKNIAVWALGELHAQEAKEFICSLKGNKNFDQYEVNKAIKKIEGKIQKPFWRK